MKKFYGKALSVFLLVTFLLTGCGVAVSEQSEPSPSTTAQSGEAATSGQTAKIEKYGVELKNLSLDGTLKGQYEGQTLTIPVMSGDFENSINAVVPLFEELSGADVVVESMPGDQFTDKVQLDLNNTNRYDIILSPVAFLHGYAEAGKIAELQPVIDKNASPSYDTSDFLEGLYKTYGTYKGKLYALPYKPDVQLLFYRKDLFEDPKNQTAFKAKFNKDLKVPETNEDMLQVAEFFTKSFNPDSPVNYGYVNCMLKGASRWLWINRGADDVDGNLMPAFNNEKGLKAFDTIVELQKYAPKEWLQMGWDEGNAFFANGNAAMIEQWPGLWVTVNDDKSPVKDKVGVAVTPGKTPTLGGWGIGINAESKNQELAWKFIEFATSKDGELLKIEYTMDPCRKSTYEIKGVQDFSPLYGALMESFNYAATLADADVPYISSKLNDSMEGHVQLVLTGGETTQQAVDRMQKEFMAELQKAKLIK